MNITPLVGKIHSLSDIFMPMDLPLRSDMAGWDAFRQKSSIP